MSVDLSINLLIFLTAQLSNVIYVKTSVVDNIGPRTPVDSLSLVENSYNCNCKKYF
jgi:hypothetical protein